LAGKLVKQQAVAYRKMIIEVVIIVMTIYKIVSVLRALQDEAQREPTVPTKPKESVMNRLILSLLLVGSVVAVTTTEASAIVYCAAGIYRAGCVARPVVVAPRPVVVAPRAVVVAPRAVVVAPRRRVY
jgi:hypothetical protein